MRRREEKEKENNNVRGHLRETSAGKTAICIWLRVTCGGNGRGRIGLYRRRAASVLLAFLFVRMRQLRKTRQKYGIDGKKQRERESLHRDGWKKPKESVGSVLKTKPYLMMNDKGRSRDTKEHRYSTFERIFFILLFFLFSFFLLEKQLVTPEDHWKLIALYRVTAQKGGDPTCNGLKRCLEDVDSLQQLRRMCMAL